MPALRATGRKETRSKGVAAHHEHVCKVDEVRGGASSPKSSMVAAVGDGEDDVRGLDSGQLGPIPSAGEVLATRRIFWCASS